MSVTDLFGSLMRRGFGAGSRIDRLRAGFMSVRTPVLMYHEVARDDVDIESWSVVRASALQSQLEHLRRYYRIVTMAELSTTLGHGEDVRGRTRCAAVTFDDGFAGNLEVMLPIVEKLRIPVTVYVATGHIQSQQCYWFDRVVNALQVDALVDLDLQMLGLRHYRINTGRGAANWAQIQRLLVDLKQIDAGTRTRAVEAIETQTASLERRVNAAVRPLTVDELRTLASSPWVTIGAHTHAHELLTMVSPENARASIVASVQLLKDWTGRPIEHFAYPSGAHNPTVQRIVRESGLLSATTTRHAFYTGSESLYQIPRLGVGRYDSAALFAAHIRSGAPALLSA